MSGDGQVLTVGEQLPAELVVRVEDGDGVPLPDQLVNFHVIAGRGTVHGGARLTDENGVAQERWTLGTVAGDTQRVVARVIDNATSQALLFASFSAVAKPAAPVAIVLVGSADRTGSAGAALPDSIAVKIADRFGNGVPGTIVEYGVQAGAGAVSPASATTDAQGIARAEWTLGARMDSTHVLHAAIANVPPVLVRAHASTPPNVVVTRIVGDAQSAIVGTDLPEPLVISVALADGRPVIGATVRWSVSDGAGSVRAAASTTDDNGRATAHWTLGTVAGALSATAVVDGASSVTFGATARVDRPASLFKSAGDGQTTILGRTLPTPLSVRATDGYGNPAAGVLVRWAVTGQGGSVEPDSSLTDSRGIAQTVWTLGTAPGEPAITATVEALAPVKFAAVGRIQPTQLTSATQPAESEGTTVLDPVTRFVFADDYGNRDTTATAAVTIAFASNPTGATLSGVRTVNAVAGVATFDNLRVDRPGSYTLMASTSGLRPDTSGAFRVSLTYTAVFAGGHSCALTAANAVYCWGGNYDGQLGDRSLSPHSTRPVLAATNGIVFDRLYTGTSHTCALTPDGIAYCWGAGAKIGDGTISGNRVPPTPVTAPAGTRFTMLSVNAQTCGVTNAGDAYCWGGGGVTVPTKVIMPAGVQLSTIRVGGSYFCAISTTGVTYCWSPSSSSGHYRQTPEVIPMPAGVSLVELVVGHSHTCGRTTAGVAYCWGHNLDNQLGDGTTTERWTPGPVTMPPGVIFTRLSGGFGTTCGHTADERVYCWGAGVYVQRPDGTVQTRAPTPVLLVPPTSLPYKGISIGNGYACGWTGDGRAYCWGSNSGGAMGYDGLINWQPLPVPVIR